MKVLTIERAKWRRGGDGDKHVCKEQGDTALLNDKGFMCCLGFDALACGLTAEDINGHGDPISLVDNGVELPSDYAGTRLAQDMFGHSAAVNKAIRANDSESLDEPTREAMVRAALMDLGWDDVVFV